MTLFTANNVYEANAIPAEVVFYFMFCYSLVCSTQIIAANYFVSGHSRKKKTKLHQSNYEHEGSSRNVGRREKENKN